MKKLFILTIFSLFVSLSMAQEKKSSKTMEILNNILSNTGGGYSYDTDGNGQSQGFWVSTGYTFHIDSRLSVSPQLIYNWDNFSSKDGCSAEYKSLRIPVRADYTVLSNNTFALGAYGGMDAERIMRVSNNNYDFDVRPVQCSVFAGASARIANRVSANIGYRIALVSFYKDGTGRNKGFEFSFNF